ncbi:unnamed protein product [Mytilus coruscus]|uniref:Integrase catalytic domain-containing protein n=1 Tax=Mytilus coruscus TaxID=42192 RepID=A0A6J8E9Z7_MYTCO|nr:unnamed protein product [Mytilus coruscus]
MDQGEKVISNIYYNASKPAAYQGADKIQLALKDEGVDNIGVHKIRKWLQNQDDFSLQKPVRRRFKRAQVVVAGPDEQLDLKDKTGKNVEKALSIVPLKDKTGKNVEKALSIILNDTKFKKIRSDAGGEFKNKWVAKLLKDKNIYHHITLNETKANYVERFNKT